MRLFARAVCLTAILAGTMAIAVPASAASEKVIHDFKKKGDGIFPVGGLVRLGNAFYGVNEFDGVGDCPQAHNDCGTIFQLTSNGHYKVLHQFTKSDGYTPRGGLVALNGVLYGTATVGGANGLGTVFAITPQGGFSVIHDFAGTGDGSTPVNNMVAVNGVLYGLTAGEGLNSYGTAFSVTPAGVFTSLYKFGAAGDAGYATDLTLYQGRLYGTTFDGGATNNGTVFSLTLFGKETVVHSFTADEGTEPSGPLTPFGGLLYGTAGSGGTNDTGTVFSLTPSGSLTVLYQFPDRQTGAGVGPSSNLVVLNGVFYGTTFNGGDFAVCTYGCGTSFSLTQNGTYTQIHAFQGNADGELPVGVLTLFNGAIYGETSYGEGTVFAISP